MGSKYGKDFSVPKDFPSVLKAFTREVLRSQPDNVYEFGAAYFSALFAQSQDNVEGGAPERLTPAQMEEVLLMLFRKYDVDGSKALSTTEFKALMKEANLGISEKETMRLMAEVDANEDGQIDYSEFVPLAVDLVEGMYAKMDEKESRFVEEERARMAATEYMLHGMGREQLSAVILDVFQKADKDLSGSLTIAEFHNCIREADLGLTRKEVNVLMHSVDVDESGTISYDEFAPLCFDILVEILKEELILKEAFSSDELGQSPADFLLQIFSGVDPDQTGSLKLAELRDALRQADLGLTRMQILTVLSEAEVEDETGDVHYEKFAPKAAGLIQRLLDSAAARDRKETIDRLLASDAQHSLVHGQSEEQVKQVLLTACEAADLEGSGVLDAPTLKKVLEECPLELAPKEVQALLYAVPGSDAADPAPYASLVVDAFRILHHMALEASVYG